jgi:carboxypeptidase C (cathepsin A)
MLSYGASEEKVPKTPEQGAEEYYNVLQNFLDKHPEIRKNPIILAGESYAGTYLPLISNNIYKANINGGSNIDLASVVLLDAWVSPITQMKKDTEYAYYHGFISKKQKEMYDLKYQGKQLNSLDWNMQKDLGMYFTNTAKFADPSFQPVYDYLNRKDVRKAINIDEKAPELTRNWSQAVSANYIPHVNNDYAGLVDSLLKYAGFKIQVISGLNDAKDCNFLGTEAWLEGLTSEAANIFHDQEPKPWKSSVNEKHTIGFVQDGGQLSWVKVLNAGHMAVGDQPEIIDIILENAGINP